MHPFHRYGPSLIVIATAVILLLVGPSAVQLLAFNHTRARMIQASNRLDESTVLRELNQSYRDIATFVEPSVVHVSARQHVDGPERTTLSSGSGWIYDDEGHVVTNYHVVRDSIVIDVQLSTGDIRKARIVGIDRLTDIAVLEIPTGWLHPAVRRDPEDPVQQGDIVFAFGSPFDFRFSMSSGVVSGEGRYVGVIRDQSSGRSGYENFIQVDAAINPGNSGGPLTDYRGHVIGMNTAIATGRQTSLDEGQFSGIGLAIPLEMIEPAVDQIIEKGFVEKGYLGVGVNDLTAVSRRVLDFQGDGVLLDYVEPEGPAERAGLRVNDIITAVNGRSVAHQTQLQSVISSTLPGDSIELEVWRPRTPDEPQTTLTITVKLDRLDSLRLHGELPDDQSLERIPALGIDRMITSSPEVAQRLEIKFHRGVVLERLVPNSSLARRVRPGATLVEVRGRPISSVEELLAELRKYDLRSDPFGGGVLIGVIQPDGRYVPVPLRAE